MTNHTYHLGTQALTAYLKRTGIDCTKNSRQLMRDLGDVFRCSVPVKALVLAALFSGYAVVPQEGGTIFTFCKVA